MTDVDRMTDTELRLRAELHRSLVPPATPDRLRLEVDRLANEELVKPERRRVSWTGAISMGARTMRIGLGAAAVVALVAVGAFVLVSRGDQPDVAATPHPTLPAITQPALPSPAAKPTLLTAGAWIDASTAWLVDNAYRLRISTDGGQSWSDPRALPTSMDLGFDMFDAEHGYAAWATTVGDQHRLIAYRTSNGGRTWQSTTVGFMQAGPGRDLGANIHFVDRDHGVMLGTTLDLASAVTPLGPPQECAAFATDDGGATWSRLRDAPCIGGGYRWASPSVGLAFSARDFSVADLTTDGGRTWTQGSLPLVGEADFALLGLTRSADGTVRLIGWSMGDGAVGPLPVEVLETRDGGRTWQRAYESTAIDASSLTSIAVLDDDHWLALTTTDGSPESLDLLESWDGGRSWEGVGHADIVPGHAWWMDRLHGMVQGAPTVCAQGGSCGGTGTILLTNDGGQTWHLVPF